MVLTTGDFFKVFVAFQRAQLPSVDAFNRVVGVAKLALRCKTPGGGEVLGLLGGSSGMLASDLLDSVEVLL